MRYKSTTLKYNKIVSYIMKHQPISVSQLHYYLERKHNIHSISYRSQLITVLEELELIKRNGKKPGNNCSFTAIKLLALD